MRKLRGYDANGFLLAIDVSSGGSDSLNEDIEAYSSFGRRIMVSSIDALSVEQQAEQVVSPLSISCPPGGRRIQLYHEFPVIRFDLWTARLVLNL